MISVLTPSRNYGRFLPDAVVSVLAQDVDVEHVVQDACSHDETSRVLEAGGERVRWVSEPDSGQSDGLNRALRRASGTWIAWLNADEFYLPGGLRRLLEAAERQRADVVYGDCVFVDQEGRFLRLLPAHGFHASILRTYGPFIASCALLVRRAALGDDPWDPAVARIMDWDLYLRLAASGARFAWVPYPVGCFRVHPGRITAQPVDVHADSYSLVAHRWGLSPSPWARRWGRMAHGAAKVASLAYWRQWRATALRGRDMRWFATEEGKAGARELFERAYPRVPLPEQLRA